ncbi:MAG: caspase family protein [Pyrinomonadaceae bacterium]
MKPHKFLLPFLFLSIFAVSIMAQQNATSREPFIFEMPEVSGARYTKPVIRLPQKEIPSLKFRVLEPFAKDITYGNIIVTLNGEGINRGCGKSADMEGKVVICKPRGEMLGGYQLAKGKNVLEVKATDKKQREYYASYLLILGDKTAAVEKPDWENGKAEKFTGKKFAVVIGISDYQFTDAGLKNLSYADDDAQAVAAFLQTPSGGSFSSGNIKLLLNTDATLMAVRAALTDTFKRAKADDLIFIFLAGHGAPDPLATQNIYFLLSDTKVVDMSQTAFLMSELKQMLDTQVVAQRVIVMIDTCHSAGVNQKTKSIVSGRQLEQEGDENNITNFYLTNQLFKQTGRAILTSSDVNEVSQESSKWGNHGVFTWALLEGLKGGADLNGDKLITAGEIFQFTRANVQKATNFQQNPRAMPGSNKDLTLAFASAK